MKNNYKFRGKWHQITPILLVIGGITQIFVIRFLINKKLLRIFFFTKYYCLNFLISIQIYTLLPSTLILALTFVYNPKSFKTHFGLGKINAEVSPVKKLTFGKLNGWVNLGLTLISIIITYSIFGFILIFYLIGVNYNIYTLIITGILYSIIRTWNLVILSLFTLIASFDNKIPSDIIYLVSAIIFGILHYFLTPGSIFLCIKAIFFGFFLAKAINETKGLFWSFTINFVFTIGNIVFIETILWC